MSKQTKPTEQQQKKVSLSALVDERTGNLTSAAVRILFGVSVAEWIRREADKVIEQAGLKAQ